MTAQTRLAVAVMLSAAPGLAGCLSEYDLVPLTCDEGADGRLYDLSFEGSLVEFLADVACVRDPTDAFVEVQVGEDPDNVYVAELEGCTVRPNDEDSGMVDLLACHVGSQYRTQTSDQCVPADKASTEVRLVVERGPSQGDAVLDEMHMPVNLLRE